MSKRKTKCTDAMVSQIVGRMHVGDSDEDVFDYVVSRLKDKRATFDAMPVVEQRRLRAQVLACHHANRELYRSGRFGGGLTDGSGTFGIR